MTGDTTSFVYVTYIASTPEKVFEAITRPDVARRYWAHENVSDWRPGSRWEHVRGDAGRQVDIAGQVIECQPPRRLVISWFDPSAAEDPAQHSRVTFEVVPFDGMVRLTVMHDELQAGSRMEAGITRGWPIVLSSLKSFLETGAALDVYAKPSEGAGQAA
ncbi:MAG: SRPBCC family protein [Candidatus Kaistia colombiensis]|nr:MAG: SRPBCC family protein [Kaistia sp.]